MICIAAFLLVPLTAGAADINWATESYRVVAVADIEGYVTEDENFGPPLPIYADAAEAFLGGCAHGTSYIASSTMYMRTAACAQPGVSSYSSAEASFAGTFIADNTLFLFDYSFVSSYLDNWITMTDLTDGTVFNNVYFDGLDGTIEVPVYEGHTIEVEFGQKSSSYTLGGEGEIVNETTMNYSMSVVYKPIRIYNGPYYNSLQAAYDEALHNETIQILAVSLTGDLNINQPISVTLESGYNNIFTIANGITTLVGDMIVSDGDLTIADGTFEIL